MTALALIIAPFLVSLAVGWLMIRFGPKDAPDGGRKTQAAPVPTSGGLAIIAGVAAGMAALIAAGTTVAGPLTSAPLAGAVCFAVFAAALGALDDARGLPAMAKLLILLGAAWGAVQLGTLPGSLEVAGMILPLPALVGGLLAIGWIFVMANAVNFMDGANGVAMGTALAILSVLALTLAPIAAMSPDRAEIRVLMSLLLMAAAGAGGFLFWNLRGKLFAGDAGSLSVGGLIGGASVVYAMHGSALVPLTLCLPILIDVFFTLAWRAKHGRPLMQAHRDHAYQLLIRAGWPHDQVARLWWGMTAVCAGGAMAGPFAVSVGAYKAGGVPVDAVVFAVLFAAGAWLWLNQRASLGRQLEADGK